MPHEEMGLSKDIPHPPLKREGGAPGTRASSPSTALSWNSGTSRLSQISQVSSDAEESFPPKRAQECARHTDSFVRYTFIHRG